MIGAVQHRILVITLFVVPRLFKHLFITIKLSVVKTGLIEPISKTDINIKE